MLRRLTQVSPASSDNNTVPRSFSEWIEFLYGPLFRVIGFFYRTYKANRDRVSAIMAREKVAALMKFLAILFLLGWILVWLFASDESRTRLTDEIKQTIGGFDTGSE
ncbi:MAG: hypothetical protein GWP56_05395 [Gammaproteobacteria bacterium]|jgi:hypothetical protein|nr:hypothetical protein [Gammaproteobacteria bacterium]